MTSLQLYSHFISQYSPDNQREVKWGEVLEVNSGWMKGIPLAITYLELLVLLMNNIDYLFIM
jgi:hypothetical protein